LSSSGGTDAVSIGSCKPGVRYPCRSQLGIDCAVAEGQESSKAVWAALGLAAIGLVVLLNFNSATCTKGPTTTMDGGPVLGEIELTTHYKCTAPGGFDAIVVGSAPPTKTQIWNAYLLYMGTASIATLGGFAWFAAQKLVFR
jgi:hypothetical protein